MQEGRVVLHHDGTPYGDVSGDRARKLGKNESGTGLLDIGCAIGEKRNNVGVRLGQTNECRKDATDSCVDSFHDG